MTDPRLVGARRLLGRALAKLREAKADGYTGVDRAIEHALEAWRFVDEAADCDHFNRLERERLAERVALADRERCRQGDDDGQ